MKTTMKCTLTSVVVCLSLAAVSAKAGPIALGTKIGIDIGPSNTANWNNFAAHETVGAGSVVDLSGTTVDGVSITTTSVPVGNLFYNNDGANNWAGLSTNGGSAPSEFVDSVTTDIGGSFTGGLFTITIDGLDTGFLYDIVTVSTAGPTASVETVTVVGASTSAPLGLTRAQTFGGLFHSFSDIAPTAGGTITIEHTASNGNPISNGVLLTTAEAVIPEPSTLVLAALGLLGLLGFRRRRRRK